MARTKRKLSPPDTIWEIPDNLWPIVANLLARHYPPARTGRPRVDFRPIINGIIYRLRSTGNRATVAAMSALSPRGRLVFRLHEKRITSVEVIDFLQQLLITHPRRHVLVVMDQARPHTSKQTMAYIESQRRLHVFYLPPYSPDWNPDEKVWNYLKNQELKAHRAQTKNELYNLTERKLRGMSENEDLLKGLYFRCCVAELMR